MKTILGYISTSALETMRAGDKCSAAVMPTPEGDWRHPIIDGSAIERESGMTIKELQSALSAALEWIDAIPKDVAAKLPTMPGFDRDWAENLLDR